ncbi:MAG: hypothetical protein P8Y75_12290 [Nitrospirota bacterium]
MQEPVDAPQVHEDAVVRDVLDGAPEDGALHQFRQGFLLELLALLLQIQPAGDDDVGAAAVDLYDSYPHRLPDHGVHVANGPDVQVRAGQESLDAGDVHENTPLGLVADNAVHVLLLLQALLDEPPGLHLVRPVLGQRHHALGVDDGLDIDLHALARTEPRNLLGGEFVYLDHPLGFIADVHDDPLGLYGDDRAFQDGAGLNTLKGIGIKFLELFVPKFHYRHILPYHEFDFSLHL